MIGFIAGLVCGHILTNNRSSNKGVTDIPETQTPRPPSPFEVER